MNQPMLAFRSSNFLLQVLNPPVQRLSFPGENRSDPAAFCPAEINRWILAGKMKAAPSRLDERGYVTS